MKFLTIYFALCLVVTNSLSYSAKSKIQTENDFVELQNFLYLIPPRGSGISKVDDAKKSINWKLIKPESLIPDSETSVFVWIKAEILSAKMICNAYRNRADAENRIKELKEDFGADSFNVDDFFATEAALNFVMMGYNLMSLFRQAILSTKTDQQ